MDTPRLDELLRRMRSRLVSLGYGGKADLAEWLGTTKGAVQFWVDGRAKPSGEMALALLEWLEKYPNKKNFPVEKKRDRLNRRLKTARERVD